MQKAFSRASVWFVLWVTVETWQSPWRRNCSLRGYKGAHSEVTTTQHIIYVVPSLKLLHTGLLRGSFQTYLTVNQISNTI